MIQTISHHPHRLEGKKAESEKKKKSPRKKCWQEKGLEGKKAGRKKAASLLLFITTASPQSNKKPNLRKREIKIEKQKCTVGLMKNNLKSKKSELSWISLLKDQSCLLKTIFLVHQRAIQATLKEPTCLDQSLNVNFHICNYSAQSYPKFRKDMKRISKLRNRDAFVYWTQFWMGASL